MAFWRRNYKDSVFTDLFGSDRDGKKNFLELYNALSGNNFKLGEVSLERKNSHWKRNSDYQMLFIRKTAVNWNWL